MPITAKEPESNFSKLPLPESGTVQAVCCGVWDLGLQETFFNGERKVQHKIIVAWEIAQTIDAPDSEYHGKPYMLNKKYTLSLGEKANLRKDLESWRGKPFSKDELQSGFDVERLYGANCYIGIKHEPDKKNPSIVYANVSAILPLPKGIEKMTPLRQREDAPPKWVIEKQQAQIKETADDVFGVPEICDLRFE